MNLMGVSKRIMEMFLLREVGREFSMARFANVAFSDGSLLHDSVKDLIKATIIGPQRCKTILCYSKRIQLCLLSGLLGNNRDIFFPKLSKNLNLIKFSDIAVNFLLEKGYEPYECDTEDEARKKVIELKNKKKWPCYFFKSDTSGEKHFEEFFTDKEVLDMTRFKSIGVIKNEAKFDNIKLENFLNELIY